MRGYLRRLPWLVVFIVAMFGYYWIDNMRIQHSIQHAVSDNLHYALKSEIELQPDILSNILPKTGQTDLYIEVNNAYRVLNIKNYLVQQQVENDTRLLLSQNPLTPVCKITSFSFQNDPENKTASVSSTIQYVDPLGLIRHLSLDVSEPLIHLTVR